MPCFSGVERAQTHWNGVLRREEAVATPFPPVYRRANPWAAAFGAPDLSKYAFIGHYERIPSREAGALTVPSLMALSYRDYHASPHRGQTPASARAGRGI